MRERRLKRWMKELLSSKGLNPENYHYIRHTSEELVIIQGSDNAKKGDEESGGQAQKI